MAGAASWRHEGDGGPVTLPRYEPPEAGTRPPLTYPDYQSTRLRAPLREPVDLPQRLAEITGPLLGADRVQPGDNDLTRRHDAEPLGQRVIVHGQVLDSDGRPVPDTLVEVWQANAAGRYRHPRDQWDAPLDPNFDGLGRTVTDALGRYEFVTVKPGAYPWLNHFNAWRPAHIHYSLFGRAFTQRLVTQMYFPDDPLFPYDPIYGSVPDEKARERMISRFDLDRTQPSWALAFEFDIVLRGSAATPFEHEDDEP